MKIQRIEMCRDCGFCRIKPCSAFCDHDDGDFKIDPNSPPPENCPLPDVERVFGKLEFEYPALVGDRERMIWQAAIRAAQKALEKDGDSE